jgi:predicted Fe-Mo cluster-binding NifX family protein
MRIRMKTVCTLFFAGALVAPVLTDVAGGVEAEPAGGAAGCRVAVAAVGDTPEAEISMTAGRAPYYLLFDASGALLKSVRNPAERSPRSAGTAVVRLLLRESCPAVLAGKFGEKMKIQLQEQQIDFAERQGRVSDIVHATITGPTMFRKDP